MYRAGRNKRASAEQLYKQCATGDCPPDVKNKIEGDTWADRLLKWFGSVVYFGGLGIGTGKGSGGSTGYRPLGGAGGRPIENIPLRPTVPVDPIGPANIVPIDTVNPAGPAIVELTDVTLPDPSIIDISNPTTNLGAGEIDTVSAVDPLTDVGGVGGNPTVISTADNTAILDVQAIPPPKRFALDVNNTPTGTHLTVYASTQHPTPDINVFVTSGFEGEIVGDVEEIPLDVLNGMQEFELEQPEPKSSTPSTVVTRTLGKAKSLYNRFTEQVQTQNPNFLRQASRAVQFEFENPAFDDDVSYTFERDIAELDAAPDPAFRDVRVLHRPTYSTTDSGLLRVSRLGERASITTRSGLVLGRPVHFYQDLSIIEPETIELQPLNNTSHISTVVDTLLDSTVINPVFETNFNEDTLLDSYPEAFDNAHLVLTTTDTDNDIISLPSFAPGASVKVFINDYSSGLVVNNTVQLTKLLPSQYLPAVVYSLISDDYYLQPSYLRRKRKRSDIF
uniref:Minor capsid protein L2 n=1 Tax=Human papillomavirus TaxID=10566 RepID=A0A290WJ71_9PAPI|nr:L2 protein [Human papillomavirus]